MICKARLEFDEWYCALCDRRWAADETDTVQCFDPSHGDRVAPVPPSLVSPVPPVVKRFTPFEQALASGDCRAVRVKVLRDVQKVIESGLDIRAWLNEELKK